MKLNVQERLMALGVLPKEGDYTTLTVIRKAQELLSFTEEELAKHKFKNIEGTDAEGKPTQQTQWDNKAEQVTDLRLGNKAISLIAEVLEKLDKDKKLTSQHLSIFEKFVEKQK